MPAEKRSSETNDPNALRLSAFGAKISTRGGILALMDDLGQALTTDPGMRMMGGGNPAAIPVVQSRWRARLEEMLRDEPDVIDRMLGNYDPPRGNPAFLELLAGYLHEICGWEIGQENLAVTCGGQSAFFYLFNMLAGNGRKIMLPLVPEYIGYANQGIDEDLFVACRPEIEFLGDHGFKYRVDFAAVERAMGEGEIAAICVSRPTNPSGNVLSDDEIAHLGELADRYDAYLIIDNAYGAPFPGVIFTDATPPLWNERMILTMSLSKLGLPGARTAVVIARPEIVDAMGAATAVIGLANNNLGQTLIRSFIERRELVDMCEQEVKPFYRRRSELAQAAVAEAFAGGAEYRMHVAEGAFFLWLWFPSLTVTSKELYQRLKKRKVLVVPGEYFFFGLGDEPWPHREQCIRVTFCQGEDVVREGIEIIADEVAALCGRRVL